MTQITLHQQFHGYRKGHQLLSASLALDPHDQDAVDRLSDVTGRLRPGELFNPYLSAYPLPSGSHYVIARTVQDLKAPRAGCVRTRSVFMPMDSWIELRNLESVFALLVPVQETEEARPRKAPPAGDAPPKHVSDGRMAELVHSLFFTEVCPIVVFDAAEADLIATRLLLALPPGLRRSFSLCTLAFGPRNLDERNFDLLFAPTSVQSRFARESFCRIGSRGSMSSEKLHRLAAPTAWRIFQSDEPRLAAPELLGLMDEDELSDRSAVRIILRWDELASRAQTTPTAVLGLLDILNSRGGLGSRGWDRLSPMVDAAVDLAKSGSSARESWDFLFALAAKVEWESAPVGLARKIEDSARSLGRDEPVIALGALTDLETEVLEAMFVLKGGGDGVAESSTFESLPDYLSGLEPDQLLRLVAASDRLAEALVAAMKVAPNRWLTTVAHLLEGEDTRDRRQVRRRLVSLVDDAIVSMAVPAMLVDVSGTELAELAVEVGGSGRFRSEAFNTVLAEAARDSGSLDEVREAVASRVKGADRDAFLLECVEFIGSDVEWLLSLSDGVLAGRLLTALLVDAEEAGIHSVLSKRARARRVVSALQEALPLSAPQIARVLTLSLLAGSTGLDIGFEVVSMLPPEKRLSLESWLLREAFAASPLGDNRLGTALAEFQGGLTAEELVEAATAGSIGRRRVSENLVALNGAPPRVRDGVVEVVDLLSRNLVQRPWEKLQESAYSSWARMLADSGPRDSESRVRASITAFVFALRHVTYPLSPLVVASFPVLYSNPPRLKELRGVVRDFFGFSSYSWPGSKKTKVTRRELIDAMVDAFVLSSWPPVDLMLAALEADVGERVVKRLRRRFSGRRYLERIANDANRLDDEIRGRVLACVSGTTWLETARDTRLPTAGPSTDGGRQNGSNRRRDERKRSGKHD